MDSAPKRSRKQPTAPAKLDQGIKLRSESFSEHDLQQNAEQATMPGAYRRLKKLDAHPRFVSINVTRVPGLDLWWTGWRSSVQSISPRFEDGYPLYIGGKHAGGPAIMCLLPKVGSSNWHVAILRKFFGDKYKEGGHVHYVPYPPTDIMRTFPFRWRAVMASSVPRVIIVRNPYERMLSAYLSKRANPLFLPAGFSLRHHEASNDTKNSFAAFVRAVTQRAAYSHLKTMTREGVWSHFRPQSSQCELQRGFSYDYVLPIEHMQHWFLPLVRALDFEAAVQTSSWSVRGIPIQPPFSQRKMASNKSSVLRASSSKLDMYYNADTISNINHYSAGDFVEFGYPRWELPVLGTTYLSMLNDLNSFRISKLRGEGQSFWSLWLNYG
mmetsp:Transcript_41851/g.69663  ORF Transcript_41851/g.69663 Transcript_41851/m.69663 type:complete len:382 (+) Transcript_41851:113-1258(+)|eukprot:CAMPEP_0119298484 /NCGR_PEP_ID=MMETSP1333-20130426/657_1 /TAXON_ID=418940 /ORGANISM="Scyphosphaera apsteinii, Strain RCC1455" /LENGTH=381 /DNA_ID=CAMNT_0007299593 /DNA_START=104 /DNA_END=1249 /DNA_ORIENTATION=-